MTCVDLDCSTFKHYKSVPTEATCCVYSYLTAVPIASILHFLFYGWKVDESSPATVSPKLVMKLWRRKLNDLEGNEKTSTNFWQTFFFCIWGRLNLWEWYLKNVSASRHLLESAWIKIQLSRWPSIFHILAWRKVLQPGVILSSLWFVRTEN